MEAISTHKRRSNNYKYGWLALILAFFITENARGAVSVTIERMSNTTALFTFSGTVPSSGPAQRATRIFFGKPFGTTPSSAVGTCSSVSLGGTSYTGNVLYASGFNPSGTYSPGIYLTMNGGPTVNGSASGSVFVTISGGTWASVGTTGSVGWGSDNSGNVSVSMGTYSIVTATTLNPEINVQGNSVDIADGTTSTSSGNNTVFGSTPVGTPITQSFVIQNTGTDNLSVTGVTFTGTNNAEFTLNPSVSFPVTVSGSSSTSITVQFNPTATGTRTATIHIANSDLDECDYDFALTGSATCSSTTWTGATSTDWNTSGNWSCGVPSSTVAASIPTGTPNAPNLSNANYTVSNFSLDASQTLSLGTGNLTVTGTFTNNGTISGTGKVILNGATAQTITGTGTVGNIELNNSNGATVTSGSNNLNITGLLTLTSGTLTTNGNVTLKSTSATATAMVGPVLGAISGNVTHERYLSAPGNTSGGRSWRLLTSPLANNSTDNSIFYHWQNNGVNNGTGIELFSPSGTGSSGNGLATGGASTSIRSYDYASNAYVSVTNTKTTMLFNGTNNNTYFTFVPGSYGSGNFTGGSGATKVNATGTLVTGTQNYSFTAPSASNIYYLMGNPYACPVDFDKVYNNSGTANINRKFWVIDPNLGSIGAYATVTYVGSSYVTSAGNQNQYIQTGQGFFVESAAPNVLSTVAVEENDKETSAAQTAVFRTNGGSLETFRMKLYKSGTLLDGAVVAGHQNNSNNVDAVDGIKFSNFNENIGILTAGKTLSIDARQLLDNNDTVNVTLSSMQQTNYQLILEPGNMSASGLTATLIDNFTNTATSVSLNSTTTYNFTVTSSAASTGTNRFKVVFKTIAPLDMKFVSTAAVKHGDKANVQWTVANQDGITRYELERSSDAKSFATVATIQTATDNSYTYTDEAPLNGNNYYRIKAIARSNDHAVYSNVVRLNMNGVNADVSVYPNPVKDGHLQINIANLNKGNYTINLYNAAGQKAATKQLAYDAGSAAIDMNIASLPIGIYLMQLTNENGEMTAEQKIVKQ